MPVTTLDPVTALLVIDLQQAIVQRAMAHPAQEVVHRAAASDAFLALLARRPLPQ